MDFVKIDPPLSPYPTWYFVLLGAIALLSLWIAARVVLGRRAPTLPGLRLRTRPLGPSHSGPESPGITGSLTNSEDDKFTQ